MTLRDGWILLICYLAGSIPFGLLLTRWKGGGDIRALGSGNIGATNVLRTQGKVLGALTLVLDFAKAALSVWAGHRFGSVPFAGAAAGAAAVVGHCFPVYLKFRGGKGIASGLGTFLFVAPAATLAAFAVFVAEILLLRYVSLGSVLACLTFSATILGLHFLLDWYPVGSAWIGAATGLLLITRHHANLRRLLAGTEPRVWGPGSKRAAGGKP
ncbi:MAG: glycerol-3-phosphate 1-O-acyltransferase PlsY [Acidobacteriota bacterium]